MPSKSLAVILIIVLMTQDIGCYAACSKCNCRAKSNWGNSKETDWYTYAKYGAAAGAALVAAPALVSAAGLGTASVVVPYLGKTAYATLCCGTTYGATSAMFTYLPYLQGIGAAVLGVTAIKHYDTGESTSSDEYCQLCCD